ncbi:4,5-DOPA-extradiol-dioxygenase [[Clostridium] fimetarium]|uniref:4,5-DOPA dioxygenase extradiol n=1 Tax=[Clostridium] fimetarium TaxID=99656 RepID=A0A1I0Q7M1_9FIRM|nr:4,5-DOPA dioxygenase extradiol [[Clostridium] fimetarium]SEW22901.1 4,5-DOPA dioxygenase extradiol [[Clostridium] fimetarium]
MMPVIFIGHGSPMNAIEENEYTKGWKEIADNIPQPKVILSISAHWVTDGTKVSTVENPKTIHDFYGFPKELYDVEYKAKGSLESAIKTIELLDGIARADDSWGLDHGTWSVLRVMYPNADIPVYQMSIDMNATSKELFEIGKKLKSLRDSDILILGSGNIVHNLGIMDYSMEDGFDLAIEFNDYITKKVEQRDFESIFNYKQLGNAARLSVPTTEHFNPLLYVLGATTDLDKVTIFNKSFMAGSLAMTSFVFSDIEK